MVSRLKEKMIIHCIALQLKMLNFKELLTEVLFWVFFYLCQEDLL